MALQVLVFFVEPSCFMFPLRPVPVQAGIDVNDTVVKVRVFPSKEPGGNQALPFFQTFGFGVFGVLVSGLARHAPVRPHWIGCVGLRLGSDVCQLGFTPQQRRLERGRPAPLAALRLAVLRRLVAPDETVVGEGIYGGRSTAAACDRARVALACELQAR